ncbi:unnamed protein product [Allacma fusca]|uniref:Uncharacterized protein n=1 Tax=Allacma fusca TaxID=39272 RepID=A0A8J2L7D6_9HEXA|nr:unnamed protein product [Allacma fusca]
MNQEGWGLSCYTLGFIMTPGAETGWAERRLCRLARDKKKINKGQYSGIFLVHWKGYMSPSEDDEVRGSVPKFVLIWDSFNNATTHQALTSTCHVSLVSLHVYIAKSPILASLFLSNS